MGKSTELPSESATARPKRRINPLHIALLVVIAAIVIFQLLSIVPSKDASNAPIPPPETNEPKPTQLPNDLQLHYKNDVGVLSDRIYSKFKEIQKEEWSPEKNATAELLGSPMPRVLKNSFVRQWAAFNASNPDTHWDLYSPSWVKRISPEVTGVYVGKSPYYGPLHRVNRPLAYSHNITRVNPFSIENRTASELFDKIVNSKNRSSSLEADEFVYYTGGLRTPSLSLDIQPSRDLFSSEEENLANIWVGEKGVVTHLHLDSYENFFIQVQGTKRFLFVSPEEVDKCYLYPSNHPSFGQSQIYPINPHPAHAAELSQQGAFANATEITVYEVTVEPGDLLYLPPNWFHQVHTLEPSISVNFWSQSKYQHQFNEAVSILSTQTLRLWENNQRKFAANIIIHNVLNNPDVRRGMRVYGDRRDSDPFGLVSQVREIYGDAFEYDLQTGIPLDAELWSEFYTAQLAGLEAQNTLPLDDYFSLFFSRYIDSRFEPLFKQGLFHDVENFTAASQDADISQLQQACGVDLSLSVEGVTPRYFVAEYPSQAEVLITIPYLGQASSWSVDIPTHVMLTILRKMTAQIASIFAQMPPAQRPNYLANFVEVLAYWTSEPNGASIPANIHCFEHLRFNLQQIKN